MRYLIRIAGTLIVGLTITACGGSNPAAEPRFPPLAVDEAEPSAICISKLDSSSEVTFIGTGMLAVDGVYPAVSINDMTAISSFADCSMIESDEQVINRVPD